MRLSTLIAASLALAACSGDPPERPTERRQDVNTSAPATIAAGNPRRDGEIARLEAEIRKLEAAAAPVEGVAGAPMDDISKDDQAADGAEQAALSRSRMCFKDYCPCDPPQQGMDTVLCDQLEQGLEVDVELMIAGRGFREARRQAAELGY